MEAQLRQAQKMESLGRLAGGISHDFNNYLTVIIGEVDLMDPNKVPPVATLDRIREAAERAADLTSKLLSFSRKQVLDTQVIDLNREIAAIDSM